MDKTLAGVKRKKPRNQMQNLRGRKKEMTTNHEGGKVFKIGKFPQIQRFLILGMASGQFYATSKQIAKENVGVLEKFLKKRSAEDIREVIDEIAKVSDEGLAVSNEPALFALAMCTSPKYNPDAELRSYAYSKLNSVVRTFPHLTAYIEYSKSLGRGWGAGFKKAIGSWYSNQPLDKVAYQMVKYRQRDNWTHRDVLLKSSPTADTPEREGLYRWGVGATNEKREVTRDKVTMEYPKVSSELPRIIEGYEKAKSCNEAKKAVRLIEDYGLTHEMLPTELMTSAPVWEALAQKMPPRALIWNLAKFSSLGLTKPMSHTAKLLANKLTDSEHLAKARIHPITLMVALKNYQRGHGLKGNLEWDVSPTIVDALEDALEQSFGLVEPTGKRVLLALDVSGSMGWGSTVLGLSSAEITSAIALTMARVEEQSYIMGFASQFKDLGISARDTYQAARKKVVVNNFGSTDCALPFHWGITSKVDFDAVVVMTDNETYGSTGHVSDAIKHYRDARGIPVKMVVCATTATNFSIADPKDPLQMDCVGFSSNTPKVVNTFISSDF